MKLEAHPKDDSSVLYAMKMAVGNLSEVGADVSQAEQLQSTMSFFKLAGGSQTRTTVLAAPAKPVIAKRAVVKVATASGTDVDESQFTKF
jgi:hypothetical protein